MHFCEPGDCAKPTRGVCRRSEACLNDYDDRTNHPGYVTLASGTIAVTNEHGVVTDYVSSDELDYALSMNEGPTCSICDASGHGYSGGPPCPLEDSADYSNLPAWAV